MDNSGNADYMFGFWVERCVTGSLPSPSSWSFGVLAISRGVRIHVSIFDLLLSRKAQEMGSLLSVTNQRALFRPPPMT
jgi:hypothetical protein